MTIQSIEHRTDLHDPAIRSTGQALARDYLIHRPAATFTGATVTTWRT